MPCIARGEADKTYESGNRVSVAVSSRSGWFVGAKSFPSNPYDGHTLAAHRKEVDRADFFAITAPRANGSVFSLSNVTDLRIGWSRAAADITLANVGSRQL